MITWELRSGNREKGTRNRGKGTEMEGAFRVNDVYDELFGHRVMDADEKFWIEKMAYARALRKLDADDRLAVEEMRERLKEKVGPGFGDAAANQVLVKMGILFLKDRR